jgi:hypothetical protein
VKALTLRQLRKALKVIASNEALHKRLGVGSTRYLLDAVNYMTGAIPGQGEPLDPRETLIEIGYKW